MKHSYKKLLLLVPCAFVAFSAFNAAAAHVTAAAAKAIATQFVSDRAATPAQRIQAASRLQLSHTEASAVAAGANAFYVFNVGDNDGFVIVAGDDRAQQVLGYSDHGSLDWNTLPENMKAWLNVYRHEIEYLQANPKLELPAITATPRRAAQAVAPLCSTTWGQEEPYYNRCPKKGNEYCVTGCVATAMAQVMYYWKYPSSVVPAFSAYSTGSLSVPALPSTTFKWNKMIDSYCHWDYSTRSLVQDAYTAEQADAVAEVMRYCGQSVYMGYDPEGSGAYTWNQADAMEEFGFEILTGLKSAYGYNTSTWMSMLNADLDAGRPILYSASDEYGEGGHAFIIDGYDASGNYHLNWGWYGTGDGYYPITALNVEHRDGTKLYFNDAQQAILGVEPPADAITTYAPVMEDPEAVTATSFTARWTDDTEAENVKSYTLYVNTAGLKPEAKLLDEVDWSTSANVPEGWTKSAFNYSGGAAYFSSPMGYVKSKTYNLEAYDKITVMVNVIGTRNSNNLTIAGTQETQTKTALDRNSYAWQTFTLDCATSDYVTMTGSNIDVKGMKIYAGEPENGKLLAAAETGDATQRIITGITDKYYNVTDLTPGGTFNYYVVATYKTNKSSRSNVKEVTLSGAATLVGDVDGNGSVDIDDVNAAIAIILGKKQASDFPGVADLDGNGNVDIDDVNAIIRIILNK